MRSCVVLLSVCYLGLAAAQETDIAMECRTNEYFEKCTYECPPEKTCETRKIAISCTEQLMPCIPKCICKDGYYRKTEGGECIPEKECGPACGENEEYTECKNPCVDETCGAKGSLKPNCTEPCVPGCVCKKDHYKQHELYPCWPKCYCEEFRDDPDCS